MGTEITEAQTGSLELAPNSEARALLETVRNERELTDEQFAVVLRIAKAPPPALPQATDQDVRAVIGSLASIKKQRRTSIQEGRLQLGLYRKVLTGIPADALKYAGEVFLREPGWMPEPAEVLEVANRYLAPEKLLHARAQRLARDRSQRLFQARCKAITSRTFPVDQFHTLTEQEINIGLNARAFLKELDGTVIPWSADKERELFAARKAELQRITHARGENGS